jgi:heme/copper-type cytochrome/quinol oxidase subunit 4
MLAGAFLYMSNPSDATQRLLIVGVIIFLIIFIPLVIGLIISMIETARRNRRKEG